MTQRRFIGFMAVIGLAVAGGMLAPTMAWAAQPAPQVGHVAPDFTFETLEGETVSLSDFRGQPVFFAPWFSGCPVCQKEMPEWQAFHEQFGDLVKVLGINVADSPNVARAFAQEQGVTYSVLMDPQGQFVLQYNVTKMPTLFFVDQQGVIRAISKSSLTADGIADTFAKQVFQAPILPLVDFQTGEQAESEGRAGALIDVDGDAEPDGARIDLDGDGTFEATVAFSSAKGGTRGTIPAPAEETLSIKQFFDRGVMVIKTDVNQNGTPEITLRVRLADATLREIAVDLDGDGQSELSFQEST